MTPHRFLSPHSPRPATGTPLAPVAPHRAWATGLRHGCAALLLAATGWGLPAVAQDAPYDEIQRLMNAGQLPEALQRADTWLAERPKDPQARFLKGMAQSRQGATEDALATFEALVRDYPELPEPHNNLAVLHAGAGRLDQARAALETAIQLNPNYATAHQNLGDVYLRLATQAYRTSLKLSPTANVHTRLQALDALTAPPVPKR